MNGSTNTGPTITNNSGIGALTGDIAHGGIGVLHGDQYVNQYLLDPAASPEQVFAEGMRCLAAGMRVRARQLVEEAVGRGLRSREGYYGWVLTIVSRRSPEDLTDEDWVPLRGALNGALGAWPHAGAAAGAGSNGAGADAGGHAEAARLVDDLLTAALTAEDAADAGSEDGARSGESADGGAGGEAARGFERRIAALPEARRVEVTDHLRYVLQRVEESLVSAEDSAEIDAGLAEEARRGRAARVPLFFTPDPLPLRPPASAGKSIWPTDPSTATTLLLLAGVFLVVGLVLGIVQTGPLAGGTLFGTALLAVPGGLLLAGNGRAELRRRARQGRRPGWVRERRPLSPERERLRAAQGPVAQPAEAVAFHAFRARLAVLAAARFAAARPANGPGPAAWQFATAHVQAELVDGLATRYWQSGQPEGLDWWLQVRARRASAAWAEGKLPPSPRSAFEQWSRARLGAVLTALSPAVPLVVMAASAPGIATLVLLLCAAGFLTAIGVAGRLVELTLVAEEFADFGEEQREHAEWRAFLLAQRPVDEEMGRWLDLDQRALLRDVLREHRMAHRGIQFTFFVLEAAPDCVRAKVPNGPPRYSRYGLKLFVLTTAGVWVCTWEIDTATSRHDGRRDFVFRFDSISSVVLQTAGAQAGATGWQTVPQEQPRAGEVLRLVLNNQEDLEVRIETHHQLAAAGANLGQLRDVALDASGVSAGFRVLAALATEGEEWFGLRRARSRRTFLGDAAPRAVAGAR